jgi:hypothetical protein
VARRDDAPALRALVLLEKLKALTPRPEINLVLYRGEQAEEQAASIRFIAILPEILCALAEGYLLAGRLAEARHSAERMLHLTRAAGNHLASAATMFRDMGIRFWLEQAEKEMQQLR